MLLIVRLRPRRRRSLELAFRLTRLRAFEFDEKLLEERSIKCFIIAAFSSLFPQEGVVGGYCRAGFGTNRSAMYCWRNSSCYAHSTKYRKPLRQAYNQPWWSGKERQASLNYRTGLLST